MPVCCGLYLPALSGSPARLAAFFPSGDNKTMAHPEERLAALSREAASLLDLAKEYRKKMESLPANDPLRPELEQVIKDLLQKANSLSDTVKKSVGKY
jgi:hypothetical protein